MFVKKYKYVDIDRECCLILTSKNLKVCIKIVEGHALSLSGPMIPHESYILSALSQTFLVTMTKKAIFAIEDSTDCKIDRFEFDGIKILLRIIIILDKFRKNSGELQILFKGLNNEIWAKFFYSMCITIGLTPIFISLNRSFIKDDVELIGTGSRSYSALLPHIPSIACQNLVKYFEYYKSSNKITEISRLENENNQFDYYSDCIQNEKNFLVNLPQLTKFNSTEFSEFSGDTRNKFLHFDALQTCCPFERLTGGLGTNELNTICHCDDINENCFCGAIEHLINSIHKLKQKNKMLMFSPIIIAGSDVLNVENSIKNIDITFDCINLYTKLPKLLSETQSLFCFKSNNIVDLRIPDVQNYASENLNNIIKNRYLKIWQNNHAAVELNSADIMFIRDLIPSRLFDNCFCLPNYYSFNLSTYLNKINIYKSLIPIEKDRIPEAEIIEFTKKPRIGVIFFDKKISIDSSESLSGRLVKTYCFLHSSNNRVMIWVRNKTSFNNEFQNEKIFLIEHH